jgi:hypothetical protein
MMEYFQGDMSTYFMDNNGFPIHKVTFQYIPKKEEDKAALNFHLTQREKLDIAASLKSSYNVESFDKLLNLFNTDSLGKSKPNAEKPKQELSFNRNQASH